MKQTFDNLRRALMLFLCAVSLLAMASTKKAQYMDTINGVTITQKITIVGNQACVTYRNDSAVTRRVGLAVYQIDRTMFSLDFQVISDFVTISLAPGATRQVCVDQPPCAGQYDAYSGEGETRRPEDAGGEWRRMKKRRRGIQDKRLMW